jgi:NitT/TauT family transport system substrate-binding protein
LGHPFHCRGGTAPYRGEDRRCHDGSATLAGPSGEADWARGGQHCPGRPWSQYYCCLVAGNREFVRKHPVATKRALRAILKAADVCALEPDRVAQILVDRDYVKRYDYALQTMQEIPYGKWREYDPEDTVRFYALRLQEAGMIKSTPQKIIAQGTDWRFLTELKRELKG